MVNIRLFPIFLYWKQCYKKLFIHLFLHIHLIHFYKCNSCLKKSMYLKLWQIISNCSPRKVYQHTLLLMLFYCAFFSTSLLTLNAICLLKCFSQSARLPRNLFFSKCLLTLHNIWYS